MVLLNHFLGGTFQQLVKQQFVNERLSVCQNFKKKHDDDKAVMQDHQFTFSCIFCTIYYANQKLTSSGLNHYINSYKNTLNVRDHLLLLLSITLYLFYPED